MTPNSSPIVARVCKHANYGVHRYDPMKDLLGAKITNIHEDGTRSNQYTCIEDYKQDFYIVKEKYRKFEQNKDYIDERMCKKYTSSRARLAYNISKILYGRPDVTAQLRQMKGSQYVFGCEQTIPVVFKQKFHEKYPEHQETEPYRTAAYDVETNMHSPDEEIIMASTTFEKVAYFAADRNWFDEKNDEEIIANLRKYEELYLRETLNRRGISHVEYELFDNEALIVKANIEKWHQWSPDWIASWNAAFDMEKNETALKRHGFDVARIYCDPGVPNHYCNYEFHPGRTHKVKENGDRTPLEWQEKFPTVRTLASWQWVDAACKYAIKRAPQGKLESYGLNATAEREKVDGKLYTDKGEHLLPGTLPWHIWMQKNAKYEYCMYNIKDNIVIEDINDKTDDLSLSLPMLLKYSEYFNYPSQPSIISDTLSFVAKKYGYVWGCTGARREKPFTDILPTLGDWIALLETEKNAAMGKVLFEGLSDVVSMARGLTDDVDVEGAYPTETVALNVGNKTTRMEATRIQGADMMKFREIGVNYGSSPQANAISLCYELFRFPKAGEIQEVFESHLIKLGKEDVLNKLKAAEF